MLNEVDKKAKKDSVLWMKKIIVGLGSIFILTGIVRQWPITGKSYMEFIEGDGYLSLMLGLIMILLGASVRLLVGQEKE
jgi:hypothetical protein